MTDSVGAWQSQPAVTRRMIVDDLRHLGLRRGDDVLVHSSLSRLGRVEGGAEAVIDALLEAVGPTGTVLFPTLTGSERDGPEFPPVMDVRQTACWTGRIPERARQRAGAVRSLHPTHSIAALGARADRYGADHDRGETPCDRSSPYFRLIAEGGHILLLGGVTQESNTTLHCLEELAAVPYHLQPEMTAGKVIDRDGAVHVVPNRLHLWQWERNFSRITAPLEAADAIRSGPVGSSASILMPAREIAETILPILEQDPLFLLSDDAREAFQSA